LPAAALDRAALATPPDHAQTLGAQNRMGLRIPGVSLRAGEAGARCGMIAPENPPLRIANSASS
jgi:hypothetical protein